MCARLHNRYFSLENREPSQGHSGSRHLSEAKPGRKDLSGTDGATGPGSHWRADQIPTPGFGGLFTSRAQEGEDEGTDPQGGQRPHEHVVNGHLAACVNGK